MKVRHLCFSFLVLMLVPLASAATYYVGPCKTGSYATIQAAVNASVAGSTVIICPGTYTTQVTITKSLNLQGLNNGSSQVRIVGSSTDQSITSDVYGVALRPSIIVKSANVNLSNIAVEQVIAPGLSCLSFVVGIYYGTGSSGTVNHSNVNLVDQSGCAQPTGTGIWLENASAVAKTVTLQNSSIQADGYGVQALGAIVPNPLTLNASGNIIVVSANGSATNLLGRGLWLSNITGTIRGNTILADRSVPAATHIGVETAGVAVSFTGNTIVSETGMSLGGGESVTGNKIRALQGVDLGGRVATITKNTFFGGYYLQGSSGSNIGIENCGSPVGANTFFNLTEQKGPDC